MLASARRRRPRGPTYRELARDMAARWTEAAADGDHYRLAFDRPGTWSQKYNLVWDRSSAWTSSRPRSPSRRSRSTSRTQDRYGLPARQPQPYAKLDWTVWTATPGRLARRFEALVDPLYRLPGRVAQPGPDVRLVLDQGREAGRVPGPLGGRGLFHAHAARCERLEEVVRPRFERCRSMLGLGADPGCPLIAR